MNESFYSTLPTILPDQDLLLAGVLDVDGAVDDVFGRGAVAEPHLLTLVALDLQSWAYQEHHRVTPSTHHTVLTTHINTPHYPDNTHHHTTLS